MLRFNPNSYLDDSESDDESEEKAKKQKPPIVVPQDEEDDDDDEPFLPVLLPIFQNTLPTATSSSTSTTSSSSSKISFGIGSSSSDRDVTRGGGGVGGGVLVGSSTSKASELARKYASIVDIDMTSKVDKNDFLFRKKKDVKFILDKLEGIKEEVSLLESEDNAEFLRKEWGDAYHPNQSRLSAGDNLEQLFARNKKFISFSEYAEAADVNNLRGSRGNQREKFAVWSNKETRTLDFCIEHAADLMFLVQSDTNDFALTPEQRLAIGYELVSGIDKTVQIGVRNLLKEKWNSRDIAWQRINEHTKPAFSFWNAPTGTGKTVMAIVSTMTQICNPTIWAAVQSSWKKNVDAKGYSNGLGTIAGRSLEEMIEGLDLDGEEEFPLARVVIAFVPDTVLGQWIETANSVKEGMKREFNYDFEVWVKVGKLKKRQKKFPNGVDCNMAAAHALGRPILWLVRAEPESVTNTIRSHPNISYVTRIYDEGTQNCEPRSHGEESLPLKCMFLQADVSRLTDMTHGVPRHPVRIALNNDNFNPSNRLHSAVFVISSLPSWLRKLIWMGMCKQMPSGIRQYSLGVRFKTLAGLISGSDLNLTGLDALLSKFLDCTGVGGGYMSADVRIDLLARCKLMLTKPPDSDADVDDGIVTRLKNARDEHIRAANALAATNNPTFDQERRALGVFRRLFDQLLLVLDREEGDELECPVDKEPIPPGKMVILKCCSNIMNKDNMCRCYGRCPQCRAPMEDVLEVDEATSLIDDAAAQTERSMQDEREAQQKRDDELAAAQEALQRVQSGVEGREDVLDARIKECVKESHPSVFDYISILCNALIDWKHNCRILFCFRMYDPENNIRKSMRVTTEQVTSRCPRLKNDQIGFVKKRGKQAVSEFKQVDDKPRVLLINLSKSSSSLEGIDLNDTDMVILDKTSGYLSPGVLVQAIGRAMRPQRLPAGTDWYEFQQQEPFPAKRVIYMHRSYRAAAVQDDEKEEEEEEEEVLQMGEEPDLLIAGNHVEDFGVDDDDDDF